MPAFYRYLGFCFIAVLLVIAGAMIGAVLYELHISTAAPDDFWSRWQAIVGSFGVLAAIGVAIFTDVKVDRRFELQIETQTVLDQKADDRQQAEWDKRESEAKDQRNIIRRSVRLGMKTELGTCIERAELLLQELRHEHSAILKFEYIGPFTLHRPVYESIGSNIVLLNQELIATISTCEPAYNERLAMLQEKITAADGIVIGAPFKDRVPDVILALQAYIEHAKIYMTRLSQE